MNAEAAAWVNAGAAVVQAAGALAAIVAAIKLAEGSARREREAIEAAERRTADADRTAEQRVARSSIKDHNNLIDRIGVIVALVDRDLRVEAQEYLDFELGRKATHRVQVTSVSLRVLAESLVTMRPEVREPEFLSLIIQLEQKADRARQCFMIEGVESCAAMIDGLRTSILVVMSRIQLLRVIESGD